MLPVDGLELISRAATSAIWHRRWACGPILNRCFLGPTFKFVPDTFESGHRIGRSVMAFCTSKKPSRFDRLSVETSFHVAAAPTHGRLLAAPFLAEAKPALPVDYADALS